MADVPRVVFPSLSPLEECAPDTLPCTHPDFRRGVWLASMSKEEAEETHRVTAEVFAVVERLNKQKPEHPSFTTTSANTPSYSTFTQTPLRYDHYYNYNFNAFNHVVYHSEYTHRYLHASGDSHSGSWRPRSRRATPSSPVTPFEDEALLSFHPQSMPTTAGRHGEWWPHHADDDDDDDDDDPQRSSVPNCYYSCPESGENSYCETLSDSTWSAEEHSCQLSSKNALGLVFW